MTSQNPWYGTVRNPAHPGRTTGGSSGGNAAGARRRALRHRHRHRHRLLDPPAGRVLRHRRAQVRSGAASRRTASSRSARRYDTVGPMATSVADVALMWSALTGDAVPEPRLDGLTVGLLTRPPSVGGAAADGESLRRAVRRAARGARRTRRRDDDSRAARRHVAALLPRGGRVAPRDVPVAGGRVRRQRAREARARADDRSRRRRARARVGAALARVPAGRRPLRHADARRRDPAGGLRRARRADRRRRRSCARSTCSAGPGSRSATCSSSRPRDEVVLAAGLAWERSAT